MPIRAQNIEDGAVTTAKLAADAITGAKLSDNSIDSEHYVNGSIDSEHFAVSAVSTAAINALAVTTAKIAASAVTAAKVADNVLDMGKAANVGASSGSGILGVVSVACSSGTATYAPLSGSYSIRVLDAWGVMTASGGGSDTFKLTDSSNDITNAVDLSSSADKAIARIGTIDNAYHELTASDLRVVTVSDPFVQVYIQFMRVA